MLKTIDALDKGFQATAEQTKTQCGGELEELRKFILGMRIFAKEAMKAFEEDRIHERKWGNSLVTWCFLESWRSCGHLLFLSYNGLYRNALYSIRHLLESIVHAFYLDSRLRQMENISFLEPGKHIDNIFVKLAISREVDDKREYYTSSLIQKLKIDGKDIDYKKRLIDTYQEISQAIHPTYRQIEMTMHDLTSPDGLAATVDCKEIDRITTYLMNVYDIFIYLYVTYFSEVKDSLRKNSEFADYVKTNRLYLTSKMLGIRLGRTKS